VPAGGRPLGAGPAESKTRHIFWTHPLEIALLRLPAVGGIIRKDERLGHVIQREIVMNEQLLQRIYVDSAIETGKPVIRGARIAVALIVRRVAEGVSFQELMGDYPSLQREDIQAALYYAAKAVAQVPFITVLADDEPEFWTAISQPALDAIWDNEEDDVYAELLAV
jgi:uncharacterized protein (DUF433 family)